MMSQSDIQALRHWAQRIENAKDGVRLVDLATIAWSLREIADRNESK